MKLLKYALLTLAMAAVLMLAAYIALQQGWTGTLNLNYRAAPEAEAALASDQQVLVMQADWISFSPADRVPDTALVLYPGAGCDPAGYAPVLREIARAGYLAISVPMPSYWSILAPERLLSIKQAYPNIRHWAVAGHSMGGGAAAMLVQKHPDAVEAMIMWDSYTNASLDMSALQMPVTSIYATRHHNPERPVIFEQAKPFMPDHTVYVPIEGGDHFQYGNFLAEDIEGFNTATISTAEQQRQIVQATLEQLAQLHD